MSAGIPGFSFESHADSLLAQGLQADKAELVLRLQMVGAFRFASYAGFFRAGSDRYRPDATLAAVWRIYEFDSHLRSLCFEAISAIEVQVRTQLAYRFAHKHGECAYLDQANFPNFAPNATGFPRWESKIKDAINQERKERANYTTASSLLSASPQPSLPIWIIAERMDFGTTVSLFNGVSSDIRKDVAATAGLPDVVAASWLSGLLELRNRCAHCHRIWNWRFRNSVKIPRGRKFPDWRSTAFPSNRHIGILLTICRYWLNRVDPGNGWTERVLALFDAYPEMPTNAMGLPERWRQHPLWAG